MFYVCDPAALRSGLAFSLLTSVRAFPPPTLTSVELDIFCVPSCMSLQQPISGFKWLNSECISPPSSHHILFSRLRSSAFFKSLNGRLQCTQPHSKAGQASPGKCLSSQTLHGPSSLSLLLILFLCNAPARSFCSKFVTMAPALGCFISRPLLIWFGSPEGSN